MFGDISKTVEKISKSVDYLKPWKTIPAFMEAYEEAKEKKDSGFFEKIGIFWDSFTDAMKEVEEEREEVSKETDAITAKSLEETIGDATKAIELKDVDEDEKKFHDEIVKTVVGSFKSLPKKKQNHAVGGFNVLKESVSKDGEGVKPLSLEQATSLGAVGLITLRELKKKYPKKGDFVKALKRLEKIKSNFPLKKLLHIPVMKIFKVKLNIPKGLGYLSPFGVDLINGLGVYDGVKAIKEKNLSDKKIGEIAGVIGEYFLQSTEIPQIKKIVKIINKMIVNNVTYVSIEDLTDIIFSVQGNDLDKIIEVLSGKA